MHMDNSFEQLKIETTQNIDIEYKLAGVGDRILATIIDSIILLVYMIIMAFSIAGSYPSLWIFVLIYIPFFFYHFLCELFLDGQSIGKKIRGIKVIKVDGTRPSVVDYFSRWLLGLVEIMMTGGVVALLSILLTKKSQRIGDMIGKTSVVKIEKGFKLEDTIYMGTGDNYTPKFPQAKYLNDEDANLIREVLGKYNGKVLTYQIADATKKLTDIYIKKLNLDNNLEPFEFLSTLLKDYNHFNGKI